MKELSELHIPVLLQATLDLFDPIFADREAVLIDGTLGMGGHSLALLEKYPQLQLIGIDRDPQARKIAQSRLSQFQDRVKIFAGEYDQISEALEFGGVDKADGILFDLGVSSLQLDETNRGFSYSKSAPLDMRMNSEDSVTAAQIIAEYSVAELARIFKVYGEERLALRYAQAIDRQRQQEAITDSAKLAEIIATATPAAVRRAGHPAKRVFQAIRIEVNRELEILERAIPAALEAVSVGGRVLAMSYHSLEDRIVKLEFAARTKSTAPVGLPVELPEHRAKFKLLFNGARQADELEQQKNPRSASVRLRAIERIGED